MQDMQSNAPVENAVPDEELNTSAEQDNETLNTEEMEGDDDSSLEENTEEAGSEEGTMPLYMKKHFRKLEKKIKKENRDLNYKLQAAADELDQYRQLFSATYSQAARPDVTQNAQGGTGSDDVETKVRNIMQQTEQQRIMQTQSSEQARVAQRLFQEFQQSLDDASDRYDDFDDVVRAHDTPITQAIAQAAQFLPNAADVLYSLSKNKTELKRIGKLSDMEQFREVAAYAIRLASGKSKKVSTAPKPIAGQVRNVPGKPSDPSKMNISQLKQFLKSKTHRKG